MSRLRTCRVCACTDLASCPGGCSWVAPDLCSFCAPDERALAAAGNRCGACGADDCVRMGGVVLCSEPVTDAGRSFEPRFTI